jgi:DNA-binding NarL/FixJ family response regulator
VLALAADGRLGPAEEAAAAMAALAADHHRRPGDVALADTLRGHVHLLLGQPRSALRLLRQAAVVLRELDAGGFLGWCLALQVEAAALLGDADLGGAAGVEARALGPDGGVRIFDGAAARSLAWGPVAEGDWVGAGHQLVAVADRLAGQGQVLESLRALHDALRLGAPVAARLTGAAAGADGGLAALIGAHAAGAAGGDSAALEEVAEAFARTGCRLMAVDAELQAAEVAASAGLARRVTAAGERARRWARDCEGASTPAMIRSQAPTRLTSREQQVARLAAEGLSNRDIAGRLSTSVRTVEGHLQQAYVKLGISARSDLRARFGSVEAAASQFAAVPGPGHYGT